MNTSRRPGSYDFELALWALMVAAALVVGAFGVLRFVGALS